MKISRQAKNLVIGDYIFNVGFSPEGHELNGYLKKTPTYYDTHGHGVFHFECIYNNGIYNFCVTLKETDSVVIIIESRRF